MLPNAEEAKRQSEEYAALKLERHKREQRIFIEESILEAIKDGMTSVRYDFDIFDEVAEELYTLGYSINKLFYHESDHCSEVVVSWKNKDK